MSDCFCFKKKKVVPVPAKTAVLIAPEVVTPVGPPIEKPYGCVRLYSGVKIGENKFSSPVVSLHTFKINNRRSNQDVAGLTVADSGHNGTKLPTYHVDSITTTNFRKEDRDEKVRCIPVEDILSISFSTDVKKEYKTIETIKERARPPKPPLGCCGRMKKSIKETCCCCPSFPCEICQPEEPEKPEYDRSDRTEVKASRLILVEMKYIRHSNIHIPSHVQVLPDDKRIQFYKENFFTDTIYFFLINQTDANPDENRFDVQRQEAERLIRVVVQLRNMADHYPSPTELNHILAQEQAAFFGEETNI